MPSHLFPVHQAHITSTPYLASKVLIPTKMKNGKQFEEKQLKNVKRSLQLDNLVAQSRWSQEQMIGMHRLHHMYDHITKTTT
jgi:hypothetical protein